jgi:hypothetical protein
MRRRKIQEKRAKKGLAIVIDDIASIFSLDTA